MLIVVKKSKSNCLSCAKRYKRYNEGTIEIHIALIMAFKKSWPGFENTHNSILQGQIRMWQFLFFFIDLIVKSLNRSYRFLYQILRMLILVKNAKSNCLSCAKRYKRYNEGTIEIHIAVIMAFKKSWPGFENTHNSILQRLNNEITKKS
jgi:hypothetical protein